MRNFKSAAKMQFKASISTFAEAKAAYRVIAQAMQAGTATAAQTVAAKVIMKTAEKKFVGSIHDVALCKATGDPFEWC